MSAPVRPRPAATIVVVRGAGAAFEVFLLRRHHRSGFMANAYVFPGGRVDEADGAPAVRARLEGLALVELSSRMAGIGGPEDAAAHAVAAIRETFEEAGVLLARPRDPGAADALDLPTWRAKVHAGEVAFAELLERGDLLLDGASLAYFDHWITPVFERRRFDTRFFLAWVGDETRAVHDGLETTDSLWVTPAEALVRHAAGDLALAPPQWHILGRLAELGDLDALTAWARGLGPIDPIMPHAVTREGSFVLTLPGDPDHPGTGASASARRARIVLRDGRWAPA